MLVHFWEEGEEKQVYTNQINSLTDGQLYFRSNATNALYVIPVDDIIVITN